jgi:hypothetical protein
LVANEEALQAKAPTGPSGQGIPSPVDDFLREGNSGLDALVTDEHTGVGVRSTVVPRNFARMMRGRVPEWDDEYIERFVPSHLLDCIDQKHCWVDEDGFEWGYAHMSACKIKATGSNVVVVASKSWGMGHHEVKVP